MNDRSNFLMRHFGLRGVAVFEAGKGLLAIVLGFLVLNFRHKDFQLLVEHTLEFLHVNPDRRFFQALVRGAGHVNGHNLLLFFFGLLVYSAVRFIEATGLWLEKEWAEWFALLSGSLYMPWEIYELVRHADRIRWCIFLINVGIVLYMAWLLTISYRERKKNAASRLALE